MNFKSNAILFIACLLLLPIGELKAQTKDYSKSINQYSFDLYRELKVEKKNLLLSPVSTYYSLLMAYEGAKGKTKTEFEKVLFLNPSNSGQDKYASNLANSSARESAFKVYNAIWLDKNLHVKERYRKSVSDKYFTDFKQMDFKNTQSAVSDINTWVSEKTKQKISEIVSAENISPDTKLLIANAVYFKGEWLKKFKQKHTHAGTFFASSKDQYKLDFMEKREILQYYETDEYQFIAKPYKSSNLSFGILLPKNLFGINELEKKMSNEFFNELLDGSQHAKVELNMPKLKLDLSYELSDALKKSGLQSAFSEEANFTGITNKKPAFLHQIVHKTYIELNEEKTEAAAATVTSSIIGSAYQDSFKAFNADHPFVFFILDNNSRAILFVGRYVVPTDGDKIDDSKEKLALKLEHRKGDAIDRGNQKRKILYVVDTEIVSEAAFKAINPNKIERMNIFEKRAEIRRYSHDDYNGLIEVTLKKEVKANK